MTTDVLHHERLIPGPVEYMRLLLCTHPLVFETYAGLHSMQFKVLAEAAHRPSLKANP